MHEKSCMNPILMTNRKYILAQRIRIPEIYPGIENLILPRLSYPGCHVRATYIGCTGTHTHGRQVTSLLCLSDFIMCNCILAYSVTSGSLF